jgi:uncharacterized damage-inducible protein DinB
MNESERIAGLLHDVFHGEPLDHQPVEAWHGPATLGLVQDLSADLAAKKPAGGVHTIWQLVLHIASWNEITVRRLGGVVVDGLLNTEVDWPKTGTTESEWRAAVERLKKSAPNRKHSNYVMLHGILHHVVYHSGQIAMLRKMLADNPQN